MVFLQSQLEPKRAIVFERDANVACPLGMAIISAILYTDIFVGTPMEKLSAASISTFPHRVLLSSMHARQLILPPGFGISDEFYHGSMECTDMVSPNVCFVCIPFVRANVVIRRHFHSALRRCSLYHLEGGNR